MQIVTYTTITGNHTFAAINAQEKYDTLSSDMNEVMTSINNLIVEPKITISGETYTLDIMMGSDYKVHMYMYMLCTMYYAYHMVNMYYPF